MAVHKLRILNGSGDTVLEYDPALAKQGDLKAQEAVEEAEQIFKEHRDKGATAFVVNPGTDESTRRIDEFDPTAQEVIIVPRMVGGS